MRFILFFIALVSFSVFGQTRRFRNEMQRILVVQDSSWQFSKSLETGSDQIGLATAESVIRNNVLAICQLKSTKVVFEESYTLQRMAHTCSKFFKDKKFAKKEKIGRLNREVQRLQRPIHTRFGIIHVISFSIPLFESNNGKYFYDKNGPSGAPNLYKGDKNKLLKELEEGEELDYIPLDGLTKDRVNELILKRLSNKRCLAQLKKSFYSFVGIDVAINMRSLDKKQIPELRVVLFLGARRLQALKVK